MIHSIDPQRRTSQVWGQSGGISTELLRYPEGASDPEWRLSMATIERACAYGYFPNFERVQLLLSGPGFALSGLETRLGFEQRGQKHGFPGEQTLEVIDLIGPCRVFNAFAQRACWEIDLWLRPMVGSMFVFPDPHTAWAVWIESGQAELVQAGRRLHGTAESLFLVEAGEHGRVGIEGAGEVVLARIRRLGS